jgi:hemolysin-activating ACP:hemolysin acyltransferase
MADDNNKNKTEAKVQNGAPAAGPSPASSVDTRAANLGRLVALLMISQRHAKLTVHELNSFLAPALALGQFAVIGAKDTKDGPTKVAAAAWWAFVSAEVDQRLTASRDEFLKLKPEDWKSGTIPWIIEAVGESRIVNAMLKNIAARNFKGAPAKLRAVMPDGRIAVGRMEPAKTETKTKA